MIVLFLAGSLMQAQPTCKYYFYSELQKAEIRSVNQTLMRDEPAAQWVFLNGKCRQFTEMVEIPEPVQAVPYSNFDDIQFVGKICRSLPIQAH